MELREKILSAESCSFQGKVTADYGTEIYTFSMNCISDRQGNLRFEVTEPASIAGITGSISEEGGNITFDGEFLCFPLLTDDHLIPAAAPWILMRTLRSGYITAVCREDSQLRITADDSFSEKSLMLDIWVDSQQKPARCDILWEGRRILGIDLENFVFS